MFISLQFLPDTSANKTISPPTCTYTLIETCSNFYGYLHHSCDFGGSQSGTVTIVSSVRVILCEDIVMRQGPKLLPGIEALLWCGKERERERLHYNS